MKNKNGTYDYQFAVVDKYGQQVVPTTNDCIVTIYGAGTTTAATIYTDATKGTAITNPILAAAAPTSGVYRFTALAGTVDVKVTSPTGSCVKRSVTPSTARIELEQENNSMQSLATRVAAGTALTASSTETTVDTVTVDASTLKPGDTFWVRSQGTATATNGSDTLTVKLYVGTEEICTTGAVDSTNGDIWYIDAIVTIRTTGASATLVGCGTVTNGVIGTATALPFLKASASEDLSSDFAIKVTAKWSSTSASNSCRSDVFTCVRIPA